MLYFIKKIAYREGGFIILEEEGFIHQQARLVGPERRVVSVSEVLVFLECVFKEGRLTKNNLYRSCAFCCLLP